jgi:hypothetical protein
MTKHGPITTDLLTLRFNQNVSRRRIEDVLEALGRQDTKPKKYAGHLRRPLTVAKASNATTTIDVFSKKHKKSTKIVMSYRRKDSQSTTRAIFERLEREFGAGSVFMDVNIPLGTDFRAYIDGVVKQCDVLIAVVGRKWLGVKRNGQARIQDEDDFVRLEIETAIQRKIIIIPVLVDGASMPSKVRLPASMREFAYRHAAKVDTGRDFPGHMNELIGGIRQALRM